MSRPMSSPATSACLSVDYEHGDVASLLADDTVLAVLGFGNEAPAHDDPRYLRVPLQPHGAAPQEVWRGNAPVHSGRDGDMAWAKSQNFLYKKRITRRKN